MSYFNSYQEGYLRYLATVTPEDRCWCGWYSKGQCMAGTKCPPDKSLADRMAVWCPECHGSPLPVRKRRWEVGMSFDENKLDDPETYYNPNKFKSMICRAKNCKHNQKEKPICKHEWVEIEDNGRCIFNTHTAADVERLVAAARGLYTNACSSKEKPSVSLWDDLEAALKAFEEVSHGPRE